MRVDVYKALPSRHSLMDIRSVEVIHGCVEAREDGRGQKVRQVLLKERLVLNFAEDNFVVQRRGFSTFRMHRKALNVRHPWRQETRHANKTKGLHFKQTLNLHWSHRLDLDLGICTSFQSLRGRPCGSQHPWGRFFGPGAALLG